MYRLRIDWISYTGGMAEEPTYKVRSSNSQQVLEYGDWETDYIDEIIEGSE